MTCVLLLIIIIIIIKACLQPATNTQNSKLRPPTTNARSKGKLENNIIVIITVLLVVLLTLSKSMLGLVADRGAQGNQTAVSTHWHGGWARGAYSGDLGNPNHRQHPSSLCHTFLKPCLIVIPVSNMQYAVAFKNSRLLIRPFTFAISAWLACAHVSSRCYVSIFCMPTLL